MAERGERGEKSLGDGELRGVGEWEGADFLHRERLEKRRGPELKVLDCGTEGAGRICVGKRALVFAKGWPEICTAKIWRTQRFSRFECLRKTRNKRKGGWGGPEFTVVDGCLGNPEGARRAEDTIFPGAEGVSASGQLLSTTVNDCKLSSTLLPCGGEDADLVVEDVEGVGEEAEALDLGGLLAFDVGGGGLGGVEGVEELGEGGGDVVGDLL